MTTQERQHMVREFMRLMGWAVPAGPEQPTSNLQSLFVAKLYEEVGELKEAITSNDLVEVVDALRDIEYLLHGVELLYGLCDASDGSFIEVHWSNMTKSMQNGVVTKPAGYVRPRIQEVLSRTFPTKRLLFRS